MNILFVAPKMPWPLDQSDKQHMYNVLKELSLHHRIVFIGCYERKYLLNNSLTEAIDVLKKFCVEVYIYKIPNQTITERIIFRIGFMINSYIFAKTWEEYVYNNFNFIKMIEVCLAKNNIELVFTNYWYTASKLMAHLSIPKICDTHNVIWEGHYKYLEEHKNPKIKFLFMARINRRLKKKEANILNKYNLIIAISKKDAATFKDLLGVKTISKIITTINAKRFNYYFNKEKNNIVLFYGALHSKINQVALKYLFEEIFPILATKKPDIVLYIVGSGMPNEFIKNYNYNNVKYFGYVDNIEEIFHKAKIMMLPLKIGSGIKGRVLEAMEAGLPVIGTTIAAEGLGVINGKHMIIENDKEVFVQKAIELLENDISRKSISRNARIFVLDNYSWEVTYGKVNKIIEEATSYKKI